MRLDIAEAKSEFGRRLCGVRILIVAPSLGIMGGQAVIADLLLRHLREEGVQADLLPINPVPAWPFQWAVRVKYLRTLVVSVHYICALLLRIPKYDIIHIFSASYFSFIIAPTPALLIARLCGKRTLLNYHSGEADDHLKRWRRRIFWILHKVDRIVVPSSYLVDVFARHGFRATSIFNIAELEAFQFRERPVPRPNILVPRSLEANYDIDTAIEVFLEVRKHYPAAKVTITGAGPDERRLRKRVQRLGIDGILLTGRVERSEMPRLFDEADIMLNTSIVDNMPVSILEAFYCGLPVVTSDAGGIPYVVRDGENGIVRAKKDVVALAAAVIELVGNEKLRARVIEGGRREAKKYCWTAVRDDWAELYLELAGAATRIGDPRKKEKANRQDSKSAKSL